MFNLYCQSNLSRVIKGLNDFHQKQLPFATSLALNRTAQAIRKDLRSEMERVFDRPTPFTLNSLQITSSSKTDLTAAVWQCSWRPHYDRRGEFPGFPGREADSGGPPGRNGPVPAERGARGEALGGFCGLGTEMPSVRKETTVIKDFCGCTRSHFGRGPGPGLRPGPSPGSSGGG